LFANPRPPPIFPLALPSRYTLPDGEESKSPAPPPSSERSRGQIPKKFGSGNGANAAGDSLFKPVFPENTRFNREKTVHYRSVRKCAKTGQPVLCPNVRCPPAAAMARNKGGPSGTGKPMFFPWKTGRSGCRCCWFGAGRQPGVGTIIRMALWMPSDDNGDFQIWSGVSPIGTNLTPPYEAMMIQEPQRKYIRLNNRENKEGGGDQMPSNQRADSKNSNNPSHKSAVDNRSNQINPNHAPSKSGGKKK